MITWNFHIILRYDVRKYKSFDKIRKRRRLFVSQLSSLFAPLCFRRLKPLCIVFSFGHQYGGKERKKERIERKRERTRLWYWASLAMVVLSPPGMIREATLSSCSGFLISTPLTPSLLSAATINREREREIQFISTIHKHEREWEREGVPAMCSLNDPWRARTPTTAMAVKCLAESANACEWIPDTERQTERLESRKPLEDLSFRMALLVGGNWPLPLPTTFNCVLYLAAQILTYDVMQRAGSRTRTKGPAVGGPTFRVCG